MSIIIKQEFNEFNKPTYTEFESGTVFIIEYDMASKHPEKHKSFCSKFAGGSETIVTWDKNGKVTSEEIRFEDGKIYRADYTYDNAGNLVNYEDSKGVWKIWEYDANNRELYHGDSDGYWREHKYDEQGNLVFYTDSELEKKEEEQQREETEEQSSDQKQQTRKDKIKNVFVWLCTALAVVLVASWFWQGFQDRRQERHLNEQASTVAVVKEKYTKTLHHAGVQFYIVAEHTSVDSNGENTVFSHEYSVPWYDYVEIEVGDNIQTKLISRATYDTREYVSFEKTKNVHNTKKG